jgi:hypothetical protein
MVHRHHGYRDVLDYEIGARIVVTFTTRGSEVIDYAVVLTVDDEGMTATIRVYDGSHGINDMHRYTRDRHKQKAEVFHAGTLGEGMRAAATAVRANHWEMIEAWREAQT